MVSTIIHSVNVIIVNYHPKVVPRLKCVLLVDSFLYVE